jgi:hypothetical protein
MRVTSYRDFILAATGGTAVFVPEPSTLFVLLVSAFMAASKSRGGTLLFLTGGSRCR